MLLTPCGAIMFGLSDVCIIFGDVSGFLDCLITSESSDGYVVDDSSDSSVGSSLLILFVEIFNESVNSSDNSSL